MDAPLCPICKAKHWDPVAHVGMSKPKAKVIAGKAVERKKPAIKAKAAAPFDKKAYQRELMRKRRAEKNGLSANDTNRAESKPKRPPPAPPSLPRRSPQSPALQPRGDARKSKSASR